MSSLRSCLLPLSSHSLVLLYRLSNRPALSYCGTQIRVLIPIELNGMLFGVVDDFLEGVLPLLRRTLLFAHTSSSVNLSCRCEKSASFMLLPLCVLMSRRRRHPVEPCVLKSAQRGRLSTSSGRFLLFSPTSLTPGRILRFMLPPSTCLP